MVGGENETSNVVGERWLQFVRSGVLCDHAETAVETNVIKRTGWNALQCVRANIQVFCRAHYCDCVLVNCFSKVVCDFKHYNFWNWQKLLAHHKHQNERWGNNGSGKLCMSLQCVSCKVMHVAQYRLTGSCFHVLLVHACLHACHVSCKSSHACNQSHARTHANSRRA